MKNNPMEQYSEWRIHDTIARLETFRCSIGWGELNDDLTVAIECMEYILEQMKEPEPETKAGENTKPHWITTDHGFAGLQVECSECGLKFWTPQGHHIDHCPHCKVIMEGDDLMNEHD